MIAAIRAEIRKLFSIRSTYVIFALGFLVSVGLMGFYNYGYKDAAQAATSSDALRIVFLNVVNVVSTLVAFSAILSVGHEYRYNTILYSLTSSKNRLKVFFGKWLVLVLYTIVAVIITALCAWLAFYVGQHMAHTHAMVQSVPIWDLVWRSLAATIAAVSYAYIITILARSLVASFAIFLVVPSMVEGLLTLLLKGNVKYLPFTALNNLLSTGGASSTAVPATTSLQVVLLYVVAVGALAAFLFVDRDAN